MPFKETAAETSAPPAEKAPDFAELQKEKERLFKEIAENALKMSETDKMYAVIAVSNYSIKDGFELARRLGLGGSDTLNAITSSSAVYKNKKFAHDFGKFLSANIRYVNDSEAGAITNRVSQISKTLMSNLDDVKFQIDFSKQKVGLIASEIDRHYTNFIRNRRVKSPELPADSRTQVEVTAEDHLLSAEAVLKESYYTGPIREFLGMDENFLNGDVEAYLRVSMDQAKKQKAIDALWALRGNTIDKEHLDVILSEYTVDDTDPVFKRILHKSRYAPSRELFDQRKRGAIKGLLEGRKQEGIFEGKPYTKLIPGIKQSLIARGFKVDEFEIKFDEQKGEYVVLKKEKQRTIAQQEKALQKENLRVTDEIPLEIQHDLNFYKLTEQVAFDDGFAKLYRGDGNWKLSLLIDAHGNTLDTFEYVSGLTNAGGHEVFYSLDKDDGNPNIVIDTNEMFVPRYKALGKVPVAVGGHVYWLAEDKKSGAPALMCDGSMEFVYRGFKIGNIFDVSNKPTYIISNFKEQTLCHGDKTLGPYDEIKLCENSRDKLVFYAKKGDEQIIHCGDKQEFSLLKNEQFDSACVVENKLRVLVKPQNEGGLFREYGYDYSIGMIDSDVYHPDVEITRHSEVGGRLFYVTYDKVKDDYSINWGNNKASIPERFKKEKFVAFNDMLFVSNERQVLCLKDGEFDSNDMDFDGTVELVNSGGKLFIVESLPDKKRVWEYSEAGELKLNDREQRDLDLVNAVASEELEVIEDYFNTYYPPDKKPNNPDDWSRLATEKIKSSLKSALEQSSRFVGAVNQTIKDMPEMFLDTLRAMNDDKLICTEDFMSRMFYYMFPEAQAKRELALREEKRKGMFGGKGGEGRSERDSTFNYDQGIESLASMDESSYYEMIGANREVLHLREPLPPSTFITRGLYGKHTGNGWTKVNVPINQDVQEPARETTFEFVDNKSSQNINLPKIANAKIITERVKGITINGEEVPITILEQNNLGEVRVSRDGKVKGQSSKPKAEGQRLKVEDGNKSAEHIVYSQTYSEIPKTMAEVTQRDYEKFRREFERSFGDVMTTPIGDVGDELDIFVNGLRGKSPREQVIAIQEFCYEYGYYNLDNIVRDTSSFEERLSIMEGRMDDLKQNDPRLAHKLYAGICTDFATLTTALLRRAGFVSGIASGFVPEAGSTSIKTDRAHAVSYVLWPSSESSGKGRQDVILTQDSRFRGNDNTKPDMIIVDGTPSNITPKIVEQEKKAAEIRGEQTIDAEKELAELEKVLKEMNAGSAEAIKNLTNGKLEKVLNHVLYTVTQSHVDVMHRVLNASRYAGFDILEMTRGNLDDQIEFREFLEEEIGKEKSMAHENRERRGEELFTTMLEFARRYEKDKNIMGKNEALDVLEKVFDIAGKYLDPIEDRSAAAIVTYLRARKMR